METAKDDAVAPSAAHTHGCIVGDSEANTATALRSWRFKISWGALQEATMSTEIAREILKHVQQSDATGEWAWVNKNKRNRYLDSEQLSQYLAHMFRKPLARWWWTL